MAENNSLSENKLSDNWVRDGHDFICHLGIMKKAIIVRKYAPNGFTSSGYVGTYYSISEASYFPFTKEQYATKFENPYDACRLAENHIRNWFNSLIINENNTPENKIKLDNVIKGISE